MLLKPMGIGTEESHCKKNIAQTSPHFSARFKRNDTILRVLPVAGRIYVADLRIFCG